MSITALEIARWRMHNQGLSGRGFIDPGSTVASLVGVQAENPSQASWAVAARCGATSHDFDSAFDSGAFLRTHVLRPTWHFVSSADILWLLDLNRERISRSFVWVQEEEGITREQLARSAGVIVESVREAHLDRRQIGERLAAAGLPASGRGLMVMLAFAEIQGLIASGARRDGNHTYAEMGERAPRARRLGREEALAEIAARYFSSHGPATAADLSYWATLTLTDARRGIALGADRLDSFEFEGETYWYGSDPPSGTGFEPRAHLLQVLDEYYRGYQPTRHLLDVEGRRPAGRETSIGMVLVDGQMVGDMKRTLRSDRVTFHVRFYSDLDAVEAVQAAADRYGEFLGLPAELVWSRYP